MAEIPGIRDVRAGHDHPLTGRPYLAIVLESGEELRLDVELDQARRVAQARRASSPRREG